MRMRVEARNSPAHSLARTAMSSRTPSLLLALRTPQSLQQLLSRQSVANSPVETDFFGQDNLQSPVLKIKWFVTDI